MKKNKPRTFKGLSTQKQSTLCGLFLRLGLPSTLICHENGARSSNRRDLKTPAFRFRMDGKIFKNGAFWNDDLTIIIRYPCPSFFSSKTNPKRPVIVAFFKFSDVVWRENIWCVFRVKAAPFWNGGDLTPPHDAILELQSQQSWCTDKMSKNLEKVNLIFSRLSTRIWPSLLNLSYSYPFKLSLLLRFLRYETASFRLQGWTVYILVILPNQSYVSNRQRKHVLARQTSQYMLFRYRYLKW